MQQVLRPNSLGNIGNGSSLSFQFHDRREVDPHLFFNLSVSQIPRTSNPLCEGRVILASCSHFQGLSKHSFLHFRAVNIISSLRYISNRTADQVRIQISSNFHNIVCFARQSLPKPWLTAKTRFTLLGLCDKLINKFQSCASSKSFALIISQSSSKKPL